MQHTTLHPLVLLSDAAAIGDITCNAFATNAMHNAAWGDLTNPTNRHLYDQRGLKNRFKECNDPTFGARAVGAKFVINEGTEDEKIVAFVIFLRPLEHVEEVVAAATAAVVVLGEGKPMGAVAAEAPVIGGEHVDEHTQDEVDAVHDPAIHRDATQPVDVDTGAAVTAATQSLRADPPTQSQEQANVNDGLPPHFDHTIKVRAAIALPAALNQHLGPEPHRDKCFWQVHLLAVEPAFQRRGLAVKLLEWGLDVVEKDVKERRKEGDLQVEGVWTVSQPDAVGTYVKAGFEILGEARVELGKGKPDHVFWVVMRRM